MERGVATHEEVDAELELDKTASGLRSAAFARAAFPDPAATAEALRSAPDDGLCNHIQLAPIQGFNRPPQPDMPSRYTAK